MYIWCQQFQLGYNLEIIFDAIPRIAMSILTHVFWWLLLLLFTRQVMFDSATPWTCSTPDFPVFHYFMEFAQTHVHWVSDTIQPYHPLSSPSSPAFSLSQHQSGGQSIGTSALASVLPRNSQDWFPSGLPGLISLLSKWLSRVFSSTTVLKHQFFGAQPSLRLNSHPSMTTGKTIALTIWTFVSNVMSLLFNKLSRFFIQN